MSARRLLFLRHGETGFSGRFQGAGDPPLNAVGREQVAALRQHFRPDSFSAIYHSPMLRCRQTLNLIAPEVEAICCPELREIDFGRWEGASFAEIEANEPQHAERWLSEGDSFTFPGGESIAAFRQRILTFTRRIDAGDGDLFVVAHGGVIRNLLCHLLRLPLENWLLFDLRPGCFCEIRLHSEGGVLTGFNLRTADCREQPDPQC